MMDKITDTNYIRRFIMEHLIHKICEIEAAASSILDGMDQRKAGYAAKIKEETAKFDMELEQETAEQIHRFQSQMKQELEEKQTRQKAEGEKILEELDRAYEANHSAIARELFSRIIKG